MDTVSNARIIKSHPSYVKWEEINGNTYIAMTNKQYWGLQDQASATFSIIRNRILEEDI